MVRAGHEALYQVLSTLTKQLFVIFNVAMFVFSLAALVHSLPLQGPGHSSADYLELMLGRFPSFEILASIWVIGALILGGIAYAARGDKIYPPKQGGI